MNILHIDNINSFSADMLLGAMIDMGASVIYIQNSLEEMGFDAHIYHDTVKRNGMEAEYSYLKVKSIPKKITVPQEIAQMLVKSFDFTDKTNEEICTFFAVMYAINSFSPEYITYNNDILKEKFDKELLNCISNEQTSCADGDIICVGYGAGDDDILRVILYKSGNNLLLNELYQESLV